jgi:hypothetical protein
MTRHGAKVIRLPVKPAPRPHVAVGRSKAQAAAHLDRIVDISERFSSKLLEN